MSFLKKKCKPESTASKLARLAELEQLILHLGLEEKAMAAAKKLIRTPSNPAGVNVRITAQNTTSPQGGQWPKRVLPGDTLNYTVTHTLDCPCGNSTLIKKSVISMEILP